MTGGFAKPYQLNQSHIFQRMATEKQERYWCSNVFLWSLHKDLAYFNSGCFYRETEWERCRSDFSVHIQPSTPGKCVFVSTSRMYTQLQKLNSLFLHKMAENSLCVILVVHAVPEAKNCVFQHFPVYCVAMSLWIWKVVVRMSALLYTQTSKTMHNNC